MLIRFHLGVCLPGIAKGITIKNPVEKTTHKNENSDVRCGEIYISYLTLCDYPPPV